MDGVGAGPILTRRERDLLEALCGAPAAGGPFGGPPTVRDLAAKLFVSDAAIKQHLLRLYEKFGIWDQDAGSRRVQLANEVIRRRVLESGPTVQADPLLAGRQALADQDWAAAYTLLSSAAGGENLGPGDLEALGDAAMWTHHHDQSVSARTRAHTAYLAAGDIRGAARVAVGLAANGISKLRLAVTAGWLAKAASLLECEADCPEAGIVTALTALMHAFAGEPEAALSKAGQAQRIGRQVGDPDSIALGLVVEGLVLMRSLKLSEGRERLDEAMARAAAGELGPMAAAIVFCRTVSACLDAFDFARAQEWTDEISRLEPRTSLRFPGDCATHQAALHVVAGRWAEAEEEARSVCGEPGALECSHVINAYQSIGEVRLRRGDLDGADAAFARVRDLGGDPEPGQSLTSLARGSVEEAGLSLRAALAGSADPLARARLLPAQVRLALAGARLTEAEEAADELSGIARALCAPALQAAADLARGTVELAHARAIPAIGPLRSSVRGWLGVHAPYEAARARLELSRALRAQGDHANAGREQSAALAVFQELGATLDVVAAQNLAHTTDAVADAVPDAVPR